MKFLVYCFKYNRCRRIKMIVMMMMVMMDRQYLATASIIICWVCVRSRSSAPSRRPTCFSTTPTRRRTTSLCPPARCPLDACAWRTVVHKVQIRKNKSSSYMTSPSSSYILLQCWQTQLSTNAEKLVKLVTQIKGVKFIIIRLHVT